MSDLTYFFSDGTASRDCTHEGSWMHTDGNRVCWDCGARTALPPSERWPWSAPPLGSRVRIIRDIANPELVGKLGTVSRASASGMDKAFWVWLDDGTSVFVMRKVTWVEVFPA